MTSGPLTTDEWWGEALLCSLSGKLTLPPHPTRVSSLCHPDKVQSQHYSQQGAGPAHHPLMTPGPVLWIAADGEGQGEGINPTSVTPWQMNGGTSSPSLSSSGVAHLSSTPPHPTLLPPVSGLLCKGAGASPVLQLERGRDSSS